MVSFGAFWVIFLQFGCLFTTYTNLMPVSLILTNRMTDHLFRILRGRQKCYFPV